MKILKAMLIFTTMFCTLAADDIEIKTEGNVTTVTNRLLSKSHSGYKIAIFSIFITTICSHTLSKFGDKFA